MLPPEPTFQAHFVFATKSVQAVSFAIGKDAFNHADPPPTKSFSSMDEAAQWLLEVLESRPGMTAPPARM
jgi:hypothetical protein